MTSCEQQEWRKRRTPGDAGEASTGAMPECVVSSLVAVRVATSDATTAARHSSAECPAVGRTRQTSVAPELQGHARLSPTCNRLAAKTVGEVARLARPEGSGVAPLRACGFRASTYDG